MKKFELRQIIRAKTDALFAKEVVVSLLRRIIVDLNNAIENRNYCCSECNFTCPDQDTMKSHGKKAHPTAAYCAFCGAEFVEGVTQQEQLLAHIKTCDKHPLGIEIRELRRQVDLLKAGCAWECSYCHKTYEKEEDADDHIRRCPENTFVKELDGAQALLDVAQTELSGWQKKDQIDREWEDKLRAILGIPNKRVSILKTVEKLVEALAATTLHPDQEKMQKLVAICDAACEAAKQYYSNASDSSEKYFKSLNSMKELLQ
jgi:hypothetical protein